MLLLAALVAAAPLSVLTASSTNGAPAACVLDGSCTWRSSASSSDSGVDEGMAFRIGGSFACERVEITVKPATATAPVTASFGAWGVEMKRADTAAKDGAKGGAKDAATWTSPCAASNTLFVGVQPRDGASPIEITSVRFVSGGKPLAVDLPKLAKATVTATSVLAPVTAYQPAFLFDARPDLAWATDGSKTDGKGVVVTVTFDEPQEIAGVMLWNGYQRSSTHHEANSRIAKLTLRAEGKSGAVTPTVDTMDSETLLLDAPLPPTKKLELVVDAVKKGAKYKDVVVSELRFLDKSRRIIAPVVAVEKTSAPAAKDLLDRSLAGVVGSVEASDGTFCVDRRMRVRSGGSFVVYTGKYGEEGVVEGGWEASKKNAANGLRVFGKKYRSIAIGEYGQEEDIVPEIFQSELVVAPFASLAEADKRKVVDVVVANSTGEGPASGDVRAFGRDGKELARGKTQKELKAALAKVLAEKGALAVQSSVFTDAMLPTDMLGACKH